MSTFTMEELSHYCNQYGFIYRGSELYGGLANTWDYGPLGAALKNNLKDAWRFFFLQNRDHSFELDSGILMNPRIWEASGHIDNFSDPLIDCKNCNSRYRADNLIHNFDSGSGTDTMSHDEMIHFIKEHHLKCPKCGGDDFTDIREFNLMFETRRGVTEESAVTLYLRPENAQGEYVNFLNLLRTTRSKLPFAVGQIGKAFRNEITPGNFTFRTLEFEQMEYQVFCKRGDDQNIYHDLKETGTSFFEFLGIKRDHLRFHDHEKLAHYAKAACDIEYHFDFGWGEVNGTHNRGDFDLKNHEAHSGKPLSYLDEATKKKHTPYIVESTYGVDRVILALLSEFLTREILPDNSERLLLKMPSFLAPIKANILPLEKKRHSERAKDIYKSMRQYFPCSYDIAGGIGKRYRRGDAIGTPYAITVDDHTLESGLITLRDRDSMDQISLTIEEAIDLIDKKVRFNFFD